MTSMLIYGANGYTGELITRLAVERGMRPRLAGRNRAAIEKLAAQHQLEFSVFPLEDSNSLDQALEHVDVVLHCAGPFCLTSKAMLEACLRTKTHYTDITGEIAVFEACGRAGERAKEAGIMVMPGVGFDVVPSDCLAMHLKNRMPGAEALSLAFFGVGKMSHGTRATMTMNIGRGGAVRRNGKITSVPAAWKTREIDFGEIKKLAVTIPWGDVSTAYYSTGIPNIEVYTVVPESAIRALKMTRYFGWLMQMGPIQKMLQKKIPPGGPTDQQRQRGKSLLWGMATDAQGNSVESRLQGPEGYTWTALTAILVAEKILSGHWRPGFQTPASTYGADLVLETPGTQRQDVKNQG
jgi:short subunit dehydrogenase-like uncharacterized protein